MSELNIRPVTPADRDAWAATYRGYRDFYEKPHEPAVYDTVWAWLNDPDHETRGLLAELDGEIVGLAHFRTFARPIAGSTGLYLDDLFTTPTARGKGAANALIERLREIARDEGAGLVRWITAESNTTARRVYDKLTEPTSWVTYDVAPLD